MWSKVTRNLLARTYLNVQKRACFPLPRNGGLARKVRIPLPGPSFLAGQEQKRPEFPPAFCIWKSCNLALRELEAAAGFGLAVFLAFDSTAVTGEEAALLEGRAKVWLKIGKGARNAVAHGTSLT
jgi:hypothetical protein